MAKLTASLFKKTTPFDQAPAKMRKRGRPGAGAAALSLLFAIAAFAVLPILKTLGMSAMPAEFGLPAFALPLALSVFALIAGFKGNGGAALVGKGLAFLCLAVIGICAAVANFAPQFNHVIQPVYRLAGLEEPTAVSPVTGKPAPAIEKAPVPPADTAAEAIVFTQNLVAEQVSKGVELNDITEAISLNETQQKYGQNVSILQGTISATPVDGEHSLVMLPLQDGNRLIWVCSGTVPQNVGQLCSGG